MNKLTRLLAAAVIPFLACALLFGCGTEDPPVQITEEPTTIDYWTTLPTEEPATEEPTTEEPTEEPTVPVVVTRKPTTTTRKPTTTTKKPTTTTKKPTTTAKPTTTVPRSTTIPDATKVTTTKGPTTTGPTTTKAPTTTAAIKVTGVAFSGASSYPLNAGATQQLTWTISPSNATNKSVSFVSTKATVATVSNTGVVTARGEGTCEIIIKTADGDFQASVPIVVSVIPVTEINISSAGGVSAVAQGKTLQLNANIVPSNASNKSVIWTSSDATVATVNSSGLVSAVNKGDNTERYVKITATAADGKGATRSVDITITVS